MRGKLFKLLLCGMLAAISGCSMVLPEVSHEPVIRNPFPQLSRVAVAPFFNHSDEKTLDGREVAMAYFAELQATPGFEVVPIGVVEEAIIAHQINLNGPGEARRLAKILGVDAVAVGAVTDYSPYYPPRCGLRVEWYTSNPGYHEIPAGYGLPWNTPDEEFIPDELVYEAQLANARADMAKLAPDCEGECTNLPAPPESAPRGFSPPEELPSEAEELEHQEPPHLNDPFEQTSSRQQKSAEQSKTQLTQHTEELPAGELLQETPDESNTIVTNGPTGANESIVIDRTCPNACATEGCLVSPRASLERPACIPYAGPVLKHTRIYRGTDPDVTEALKGYVYFKEDARFGGWESYLQRSDDFVRFCCHMHISEMLAARGGSRKTRVVWRWSDDR